MSDVIALEDKEIKELIKHIAQLPDRSEALINNYFKNYASSMTIESIMDILPSSGRTWKGKTKAAKNSNPFETDYPNLGFKVKSKSKYNYLVFPDLGIGTSKNNDPQEFMEKGLDIVHDEIIEGLLISLKEAIEEE
ncbi:MAG: hypothetical protein KHY88_00245 [Erysipelotrichaceae bacterium]|nr:hypothetical protein [Erysipelotrichaceae bacterium]